MAQTLTAAMTCRELAAQLDEHDRFEFRTTVPLVWLAGGEALERELVKIAGAELLGFGAPEVACRLFRRVECSVVGFDARPGVLPGSGRHAVMTEVVVAGALVVDLVVTVEVPELLGLARYLDADAAEADAEPYAGHDEACELIRDLAEDMYRAERSALEEPPFVFEELDAVEPKLRPGLRQRARALYESLAGAAAL